MFFLARCIARLPLWLVHVLGAGFGWLAYGLIPRHRHHLNRNLLQAGYTDPTIRKQAIAHSGISALEVLWVWFRRSQEVQALHYFENLEVYTVAASQGRGVVVLTPHLGGYEVMGRALALSYGLSGLYKPHNKAYLTQLVSVGRSGEGLTLAPTDAGGVRTLLRTLKNKGTVFILPDQVPQTEGVWAPFFSQPAYTMTLAIKLAQSSGAVVLAAGSVRLPKAGGWRSFFLPQPLDLQSQTSGDLTAAASRMNTAMQDVIAKAPEQYNWGYNRYKGGVAKIQPTV